MRRGSRSPLLSVCLWLSPSVSLATFDHWCIFVVAIISVIVEKEIKTGSNQGRGVGGGGGGGKREEAR